jgi:hypothetical protein
MSNPTRWKKIGGAAGLVASGLVAGGILAGTLSASADTGTTTSSDPGTSATQSVDPSQPQRSDEELLTGDTKASVEDAVLAEYPGATIERTETDSAGVYESHIVTVDGEHLIVQVGEDFAVTGTETGGPGGPGGPAGSGDSGTTDDTGGA